nr:MAG TPA: hypothetical protein [Caudoviricetes sp.]
MNIIIISSFWDIIISQNIIYFLFTIIIYN